MSDPLFAVTRFLNRNGVISWRVTGSLCGVRIRKNYKTKEEAAAEMASLELKAAQATSGQRSVTTHLTPDQVREAEAAFRRLEGKPHTLVFCADYVLANYRAPEREKLLADAVIEYQAAKATEQERGVISAVQVDSIRKELALLKAAFPNFALSALTSDKLAGFCDRGKPSLKTYNNRSGILSTLFKFALRQ